MKALKLSDSVVLQAEDYAVQASAFLGIRGTGKTTGAKDIAEWLITCTVPITVFDPTGMWKHMKTAAPRPSGRGFDVVVAGNGPDADLPLTVASAGDIMRAAMKERVNIVFDLRSREFDNRAWYAIVHAAAKVLFHENHEYGVRHLFVEEAGEFIPQTATDASQHLVKSVLERAVRLGGNDSLGVTLINQRSEQVSKSALENCVNLFLHKQMGSLSLQAVDKWLKYAPGSDAKEIVRSMPGLKPGQCWIWTSTTPTPQLVQMEECRSYHPDRKKPVILSPTTSKTLDVSKWVAKLKMTLSTTAAAIEEQKKKDRDADVQTQLREQIKTLQRELSEARIQKPAPPGPPQEVPILDPKAVAELEHIGSWLEGAQIRTGDLVTKVEALAAQYQTAAQAFRNLQGQVKIAERPVPVARITQNDNMVSSHPVRAFARNTNSDADDKSLGTGGPRRMLIALAQRSPLSRSSIIARSQMAPGSFPTYSLKLKKLGFMEVNSDGYSITPAGLSALGNYTPLPEGADLQDYYLHKLGDSGPSRMLRALCDAYPQALTTEAVCRLSGIAEGSFPTYSLKLKNLGLITSDGPGLVKASSELFTQ